MTQAELSKPPQTGVISSRLLTAQTYEMESEDTLRSQISKMLNEFISVYAVSCSDSFATTPQYLDNYFIMVKPGRVVIRGLGNSSIAQLARPYEPQTYSHNLPDLKKRLGSGRLPSIYE